MLLEVFGFDVVSNEMVHEGLVGHVSNAAEAVASCELDPVCLGAVLSVESLARFVHCNRAEAVAYSDLPAVHCGGGENDSKKVFFAFRHGSFLGFGSGVCGKPAKWLCRCVLSCFGPVWNFFPK